LATSRNPRERSNMAELCIGKRISGKAGKYIWLVHGVYYCTKCRKNIHVPWRYKPGNKLALARAHARKHDGGDDA
jgi:hypothetical protein